MDQPIVCRLAFNQMTHAFELWMRQKLRQLWLHIRPGKIDPTNHPGDKWILIGKTQKPSSFFETIARLHQDRFFNATLLQYRLERRRQIVAKESFNFTAHPWIVETPNLPKMLVTIDNAGVHIIFYFPFDPGFAI